jgi:hypothetical protein
MQLIFRLVYRAYSEDTIVLIKHSALHESGLIAVNVDVETYSLDILREDGTVTNVMLLLTSLPSGPLKPDKFVKDSHVVLKEVIRSITRYFVKNKPNVAAEWTEWATKVAPKTDDTGEYCAANP